MDEEGSISGNANCRSKRQGEVIEALRLAFYANRLPRTPVLQGHKFIRKGDRIIKSASYFADGNKIKRTPRDIKDRMER